ncbi:MAG: sigma-70 family RNA polymerase sigma factor [Deltaproteobacteria bacterium]|nr:sigma-70 family RNA polymerase sigma factor [Deltaproteobacteria bacterium]
MKEARVTRHETTLAAAVRGDDDALAVLVRTYHHRLYRFGLRVCRDGYDADDAVQEAFVKLAGRADVVKHPGALSWLMTVVRNACMRMLRPFARQRRALGDQVGDDVEVPSGQIDPREAIERLELVQAVHAAIATLERPYREVLLMRDLEGMTGEETCVALGLELATMKTRLHRARTKLRDELTRSIADVSSPRENTCDAPAADHGVRRR